jgi:dTDP-4-dehydrorhamnose reductase
MYHSILRGDEVMGLCRSHSGKILGKELVPCDLLNHEEFKRAFDRSCPDLVIHTAALTNVDYCEEHADEAFKMNQGTTELLAHLCAKSGVPMVYISTDAVYNGAQGMYSESDETVPVNNYAKSTLQGETSCLQSGADALVVRCSIYGWNWTPLNRSSFGEAILKALLTRTQITLFDDVYFSPILVTDLIEAVENLLRRHVSGVFNIGASERISKLDYGWLLADVFGILNAPIVPIHLADRQLSARRPKDVSLNVSKFHCSSNQHPITVRSGLEKFRDFLLLGNLARLKNQEQSQINLEWPLPI